MKKVKIVAFSFLCLVAIAGMTTKSYSRVAKTYKTQVCEITNPNGSKTLGSQCEVEDENGPCDRTSDCHANPPI